MPARATTLLLVRHASHDIVDRVLCGRMPGVRLGAVGREQASGLADRLARRPLAAVFTSPRERCRETAEPIAAAHCLDAIVSPGFDEIDFGAWTGRSFADLAPDPLWQSWNERREQGRAPRGETMRDVSERVGRAIEEIRVAHPDGTVAAVSHCDVIKAAVANVLGLSLDRWHAFEIAPSSVTTLLVWQGGCRLLALNEVERTAADARMAA